MYQQIKTAQEPRFYPRWPIRPLEANLLHNPEYDPTALLDYLISTGKCKNDAGIAERLAVMPSVISKVRHRKLAISEALMVRIHESCGLSIGAIKELIGVGS